MCAPAGGDWGSTLKSRFGERGGDAAGQIKATPWNKYSPNAANAACQQARGHHMDKGNNKLQVERNRPLVKSSTVFPTTRRRHTMCVDNKTSS